MCERRVALNPVVAHSTRAKDADESDNSLQEEQKTQMDDHTPIKAQYFTYLQTDCSLYISSQHAGWMMVVVPVSGCCSVPVSLNITSVLCWAATSTSTSQAHDAGLHQTQNNSHDPATIASHLIFILVLYRYLIYVAYVDNFF